MTDIVRWFPFLLQRGLVDRIPDEGWNRTAVGSAPCPNRTDTLKIVRGRNCLLHVAYQIFLFL